MDALEQLREQALKAREYEHVVGECTLTLRLPTRQEVRAAVHAERLAGFESGISAVLLQDALVRRGLVGWTGVRECHVAPTDSQAPLPWSRDAAHLWIDANPDEADRIGQDLMRRLGERADRLESAAKN